MRVKFVQDAYDKTTSFFNLNSKAGGLLFGFKDSECTVITECVNILDVPKLGKDVEWAESLFPSGIGIQGVFAGPECTAAEISVLESKDQHLQFTFSSGSTVGKCYKSFEGELSEEIPYDIISRVDCLRYLVDNKLIFHIGEFYTIVVDSVGAENVLSKINFELDLLRKRLLSKDITFFLPGGDIMLPSKNDDTSISSFLGINEKQRQKVNQSKPIYSAIQVLQCEAVHSVSVFENRTPHSGEITVPQVNWSMKTKVLKIPIAFSAISIVDKSLRTHDVALLLRNSLHRQVTNIKKFMASYWLEPTKKLGPVSIPKIYHICLPSSTHSINICYPGNRSDSDLVELRRSVLHPLFMEAPTQPLFTKLNSFPLRAEKSGILINTHEGLKPPNVPQSELSMVHGLYGYHHYMQDRFDDNGWGCAYRSCQTIVSWYRHQGYTNVPIPSHRVIQQALVDVGDKPKEFVGSKLWIGSIEISNILNHLLGVTSKILFVSRGSELATKGRELACHFRDQGTPVMIGGGVLAHTILGVCFSEVTGDTRFLILDPHYTGTEDLKVIQNKGWCGWKGTDFWNQSAYYNLCMPQRPVTC